MDRIKTMAFAGRLYGSAGQNPRSRTVSASRGGRNPLADRVHRTQSRPDAICDDTGDKVRVLADKVRVLADMHRVAGRHTSGTGRHASGTGRHASGTGRHASGTGRYTSGTGRHASGVGRPLRVSPIGHHSFYCSARTGSKGRRPLGYVRTRVASSIAIAERS